MALTVRNFAYKCNPITGLERTATGGLKGSADQTCGTIAQPRTVTPRTVTVTVHNREKDRPWEN